MNTSTDFLPTLFIRDSKGKAREWSVTTDMEKIIVTHGVVNGKLSQKITKAKAKNIGKSNETTPEQQAKLEAQSKWNHQKDREDYHFDILVSGLQSRPMLALDYNKVPHRVNWSDAVSQPKLDGLRLVSGNRNVLQVGTWKYLLFDGSKPFEMLTRKGETYKVAHLIDPCVELLGIINGQVGGRCVALDGEAYLHGLPLQKITSLAKKYKKGETEKLEFHLFDLIIPGMDFRTRHAILAQSLEILQHNKMKIVEYTGMVNEDEMKMQHSAYTEDGYEGLMIRHGSTEYALASRSSCLFKYKHFHDDEFKIIGMWEDTNGNAMFTVEMLVGKTLSCDDTVVLVANTFNVTPKRTHDERKAMLLAPGDYIGKWLKVKYQDLTEDLIPTFPVGLDLRECDDEGNPLE